MNFAENSQILFHRKKNSTKCELECLDFTRLNIEIHQEELAINIRK